jgi:putative endonuclease
MPSERDEFGRRGEELAERFLIAAGLKFVTRRYGTPVGELDLVFLDGRTVVFVEVKTQRDRRLLDPHERVTTPKQRKLLKAAEWFLHRRRLTRRPCRFDVVGVVLDGIEPEVVHVRDAFVTATR